MAAACGRGESNLGQRLYFHCYCYPLVVVATGVDLHLTNLRGPEYKQHQVLVLEQKNQKGVYGRPKLMLSKD